jgi:acetyltransferase-like isoleucine patch superfamily enzyme
VHIDDAVFVGHGVMFTNTVFPRATNATGELQTEEDWKVVPTHISEGAFIGSGSVILCGITIGRNAAIGAGAVVTKDVPAGEIWVGNPARFLRRVPE